MGVTVVDCEGLHGGLFDQPVNTWSALAFVVVGAWLVLRPRPARSRLVGAASITVGAGSVMFHGFDAGIGSWLHDWSILLLLAALLALTMGRSGSAAAAVSLAAVGGGLAIAIRPALGEWLAAGLVVAFLAAVWGVRRRHDQRLLSTAVVLLGIGAVLAALGRTGAPWCRPESLLQPHAAWHLLAAASVGFYASAVGKVAEN